MKKLLTLSSILALCALCASASEDTLKLFSASGDGNPQMGEPSLMGLAISANGKYICGAGEMGAIVFVADRETGEVKWAIAEGDNGGELRHIDNEGTAIGFCDDEDAATLYSFNNPVFNNIHAPAGFRGVMGEAISNDGSIITGSLTQQSFDTKGAYRIGDGEWQLLDIPTEEEIGTELWEEIHKGASATKNISGDGNVILGNLGSFALPIIWVRNDEGVYEYDFFPHRLINGEMETEVPLMSVSGMYLNMSNNGKYACFVGQIETEEGKKLNIPVIYDIENRELILYSEQQAVDVAGAGLYPLAISNDGTFIGTIGQPYFNSYGSFIMMPGEKQAKKYVDVFASYAEKLGVADSLGFDMPVGISADGRYLLGYSWYSSDYYDTTVNDAMYVTYVIDRGETVGVDKVGADILPEMIFTIDGKRVEKLTKGINIVRQSDGTVKKILVK